MAVTKVNTVVVSDVPDHDVETVLSCVRKAFPTFETGGGDREVKVHDTEFMVSGLGGYRRIEHVGSLARPLREQIASFAKGVLAALAELEG